MPATTTLKLRKRRGEYTGFSKPRPARYQK